jgi:hypothetical protein
MAHDPVPRRFGKVEQPYVPLDRLDPGRWTGILTIAWAFSRQSPLVVGNGRLTLWKEERRALNRRRVAGQVAPPLPNEELVLDVVRRGAEGMPVIPGSSLKGAVRQVYELLTPSCDPFERGSACRPRPPRPRACPACSLFGGLGLAGRASFQEATPAANEWRQQLVRRAVPQGWEAQRPVPGTTRMYGQGRARNFDGGLQEESESTWAAHGTFTSRIRLLNASDDELGLLFASLGIGWRGDGPSARLGGRKFHGFGSATVTLTAAEPRRPWQPRSLIAEPAAWADRLRDEALDRSEDRRHAWDAVHQVLANPR